MKTFKNLFLESDYDPSVHERGTDAGRKWAQEFTPGQSVDSFIKEEIKRQKDFSAKTFSQVVGNPLEGYPYNEEMQVNEVEESRYSDEKNKRQKATLKKHDSAMIKVARKSIKKYDANNKNKNEDVEEACWDGYKQVGMKKKGNKEVPNCVPEANTMGNVKKTLSKVKGLSSDQLKTLMTIPQSQLMVIAQQLSSLVMGEEIHESQIETHLPQLDEVMSMQTRLKMKKAFRKNKHKIAIGRKKAAKRMVLDPKKIEKRATKAARKVLEKKFLKGADKNSLGHAGKAALEKKIEKKKSVIAKIARKLKKVIRKKESMKFKKNKETWDKAGKDLKSKK
jgi:hypothetical protein